MWVSVFLTSPIFLRGNSIFPRYIFATAHRMFTSLMRTKWAVSDANSVEYDTLISGNNSLETILLCTQFCWPQTQVMSSGEELLDFQYIALSVTLCVCNICHHMQLVEILFMSETL